MTRSFLTAYKHTMQKEGGYANSPLDRGGETYCGISRKFHPSWIGWKTIDRINAKRRIKINEILPELSSLVMQFYFDNFWQPNRCEQMPDQISFFVFDSAVNHGSGKAGQFLQKALNVTNRRERRWDNLIIDGVIGSNTLTALNKAESLGKIHQVNVWANVARGAHYMEIMEADESQEIFSDSWASRLTIELTIEVN